MWAQSNARLFGAVVAGLAGLAWASLLLLQHEHRGLAGHGSLSQVRLDAAQLELATVFIAGWLLMTVAMMLPTTLPLVTLFATLTGRRERRGLLLALLLLGYLLVWLVFGTAAYIADIGIHGAVESNRWLHEHSWLLLALLLLTAGVYQFTPLKYLCLDRCRSPLGMILEGWHGLKPPREALQLGLRHGLFCLGCCWSLMLLMFAVGVGNLAWMLALAAVMGVEKNLSWGRRIGAPAGIVLVTAGLTVMALNSLPAG